MRTLKEMQKRWPGRSEPTIPERIVYFAFNENWEDKFVSAKEDYYADLWKMNNLNEKYLYRSVMGTLDGGQTYKIVNPKENWLNAEGSLQDLFDLINEGVPITNHMEGGIRTIGTFVKTNIAMVDIDDATTINLDNIEDDEFYQKYCAGFYTTPSHTEDDHRLRLIFVLDRVLEDELDIRAVYVSLIKRYGGDPSCVDGSRIFFGSMNADVVKINEDRFVPDDILDRLIKDGQPEVSTYVAPERIIFTDEDKEELLNLLKNTVIDHYGPWWKMLSAMKSAGYTFADLCYVSEGNPNHSSESLPNKTAQDMEYRWKSFDPASARKINPGYLWNLVGGKPKREIKDNSHAEMYEAIAKLSKREPLIIMDVDNKPYADIPMPVEISTLEKAMGIETSFKCVEAPTGSGKTYNMVKDIIHKARLGNVKTLEDYAGATFEQCLIVVPSLVSVDNILHEFYKQLGRTDDVDYDVARTFGVYAVISETNTVEIPANYRVVITTAAYVLPKGDSNYFYAFMENFNLKPHVYIDEIDNFIENNTVTFTLGHRYVDMGQGLRPFGRCFARTQKNNACDFCQYHKAAFHYTINNHHLPELELRTKKERNIIYDTEWIDQKTLQGEVLSEEVIWDTTTIKFLKEYPLAVDDIIIDAGPEGGDDKASCTHGEWVKHVRETCWRPIIMTEQPVDLKTNEQVSRDIILESGLDDNITNQTRKEAYLFPYNACNVPKFVGISRESLSYISHNSSSLTVMTATMGDAHKQYISDCGIDMKYFKSTTAEEQMMDKVNLILVDSSRADDGEASGNKNYIKQIVKDLSHEGKPMLVFEKDKRGATVLFNAVVNKVKNKTISSYTENNLFVVDKSTIVTKKEETVKEHVSIIYARSPLARGQNMGEYKIVLLAGDPLPPLGFCSGATVDELLHNILENRISILVQCEGRIQRRELGEEYAERWIIVDVGGMHLNFKEGKLNDEDNKIFNKIFFEPLSALAKDMEVFTLFGTNYRFVIDELDSIISGDGRVKWAEHVMKVITDNGIQTKGDLKKHFGKAKGGVLLKSPLVKKQVDKFFKDKREMHKVEEYFDRVNAGKSKREVYDEMHLERLSKKYKEMVKDSEE